MVLVLRKCDQDQTLSTYGTFRKLTRFFDKTSGNVFVAEELETALVRSICSVDRSISATSDAAALLSNDSDYVDSDSDE